jgi:4-amino-4-deoxy-L-arabinose transferase-like glycosyltransferase
MRTLVNRLTSPWLGLLLLCGPLFFYQLGSYPLLDVDEPRYAEAGRQMLLTGDWITPMFNGVVRFDKPVFFYWLVALAYQGFGVSEFAARFFSALSGTLLVLGTVGFARLLGFQRAGWLAGLILASSLQIIALSRMAITDMTLCLLMTGVTMSLFLALVRSPRWWVAAGVLGGLAVLTKGPVGVLLPGVIITVYALFSRQAGKLFLTPWFAVGWLLTLGVSLPWYVAAAQANGHFFVDALLFHNMTRFGEVVSGHYQPWYFYGLVLLAGFVPWTLLLPWAAQKTWQWRNQLPPLAGFALVWAVTVLLFFQVAQTKLLTYILPMFPALALWVGCLVDMALAREQVQGLKRLAWLTAGVLAVFGVAITVSLPSFLPKIARQLPDVPLVAPALVACLLVWGAGIWAFGLKRQPQSVRPFAALALAMAGVTLVAVQGILPRVSQAQLRPIEAALKHRTDEKPLVLYQVARPTLTFYGQRPVVEVTAADTELLGEWLAQVPGLQVLTKKRFMPTLQRLSASTVLYEDRVYCLIELHPQKGTRP